MSSSPARSIGSAAPGGAGELLVGDVPPGLLRAAPGGDLWRVMFEASPVACSIVDIATGRLVANRAYRALFRVPEDEEITIEDVRRRAHPDELAELSERFAALDRGEVDRVELDRRYVRADGTVIWGHLVTTLVRDERGEPVAVVGQMEDITGRVEAERRLRAQMRTIRAQADLLDEQNRRLSEQAHQLVVGRDAAVEACRRLAARVEAGFEHSPIGIAMIDAAGVLRRANPALCRMLGEAAEQVAGRTLAQLLEPDTEAGTRALEDLLCRRAAVFVGETRCRRADGAAVWADVHIIVLTDEDGRPLGFFGQLQDVTERRRAQHALAHEASHDALTGLANRHHFFAVSAGVLGRARGPGDEVALLFIDVDRFKAVNDGFGHAAGDALLRGIAARLTAAAPEAEIARLGGDEFAVMALVPRGSDGARQLADRLHTACGPAIDIGGVTLHVSLSIGTVCTADDVIDVEQLLRDADAAMYRAKAPRRLRARRRV